MQPFSIPKAVWLWLLLPFLFSFLTADPAHSDDSILNLDKLVQEAVQNNPEIQAARKKWEAIKERIPQAEALEDPMLGFGIINLPTHLDFRGEDMTMKEISISQRLPFPGKRDLMREMAEGEAEAAYIEIQGKAQAVIKDLRNAYYDLSHVYRATEVIERNKTILETFVKLLEARYSVGEGAQQDLLKAHVEVSRMVDDLLMQVQRRQAIEAKIKSLINRPQEATIGKPQDGGFRRLAYSLEQVKAVAVQENPALRGMKRMIQVKETAHELAKKEYYPDFNLRFSYGQRDDGLEMKRRDTLSGMVEMNIPVFQKSKQERKVAETLAEIQALEARYQAMKNEVCYMVTELVSMLQRIERQLDLYRTGIIPQVSLQIDAARAAYKVDRADFMTLLESEMILYRYELEYHLALTEYEKNLAALSSAAGRDVLGKGDPQ